MRDELFGKGRTSLRGIRQAVAPRGTTRGAIVAAVRDARARYPKQTRAGLALRILVVAPPKSGNHWVKCLLANAYGLAWIPDHQAPTGGGIAGFRSFIDLGRFKPGTILHQHYSHSAELVEIARREGITLVTVIRDPYDLFVSYYYHLQTFGADHVQRGAPAAAMKDKPLDHPDVLDYLAHHFGAVLRRGISWVESGDSIVVRYEDLHRDQAETLGRVTDAIQPVDMEPIQRAIAACTPDKMRRYSGNMSRFVRSATVGDSRQKLEPEHLAIFRDRYAKQIRALGYEVR